MTHDTIIEETFRSKSTHLQNLAEIAKDERRVTGTEVRTVGHEEERKRGKRYVVEKIPVKKKTIPCSDLSITSLDCFLLLLLPRMTLRSINQPS